MSEDTFESLVETGKLLPIVPRRDVRKWAAYIERERSLRGDGARIAIIREHLNALDNKVGPSIGVAGFLVAATPFIGNYVFSAQTGTPSPVAVIIFFVLAAATLLCAVYAMSALGMEMPDDAAEAPTAPQFEYRLLQRLVYRARNHAWGLRSAQLAGIAASLLIGGYIANQVEISFPG